MARRRVPAAVRKRVESEAQAIGAGVYSIATELQDRRDYPLPLPLTAPLIYVSEIVALEACRANGWREREQVDRVARFMYAGLQELVTARLGAAFDTELFERWIAAEEASQGSGA